jgi:hypothetical protein
VLSFDRPEAIEIELNRVSEDELPFYCVSPAKLAILSLASLGLYELFWFYKNWKMVEARSDQNISPFWRALFSPIFCYYFATTTNSAAESLNITQRIRPGIIATAYIGLILLQRLPDPYWLICFLSFVPLIPITRQIHTIHTTIRPGFESTVGWGRWSFATVAVCGPIAALAALATFGPPTKALRASEIPAAYQRTLVSAGVLEPGEPIQFFYSGGLFSILEDGNLLTKDRIITYETFEGEFYVSSSPYAQIRDLDIEYSKSFLDDTVLTITTVDDKQFILIVSPEDGRDKEFVADLRRRAPGLQEP